MNLIECIKVLSKGLPKLPCCNVYYRSKNSIIKLLNMEIFAFNIYGNVTSHSSKLYSSLTIKVHSIYPIL